MITTMPQPTETPTSSMIPVPPPSMTQPVHDCSEQPVPPRSEWFEAYHCSECDELTQETGYALYECSDDGTCFVRRTSANCNNQCPVCFRFARKISDHACYECEDVEADIVWVYDCPVCEDLVLAPDQEADRV